MITFDKFLFLVKCSDIINSLSSFIVIVAYLCFD